MHILLAEEFASGAVDWVGTPLAELAPQGIAMLSALAEDAAAVDGWSVHLLWGRGAGDPPEGAATIHEVPSPEHYHGLLARWSARVDRTLVVAPETDRRLEEVRRVVDEAGGHFAGCSPQAVAICGDKLRLAAHLEQAGISTPPTWPLAEIFEADEIRRGARRYFPLAEALLVKPRYGAGASDTFLVRNSHDLREIARHFARIESTPIVQPYVAGRAMSVAAIVSPIGCELFPAAEQGISSERQFRYFGGAVDGGHFDPEVESLVRRVIGAIDGLLGYVGFDLIIPYDGSPPVLIEINPRLTTSYLGYRRLAATNLALRVLDPEGRHEAIRWRGGRVEFTARGP